jgi:broad specificity phosphatase PhoE
MCGRSCEQKAHARAERTLLLLLPLQLLVVSPLTRALQTATLAFGQQPGCPVLVEPLWRERLYQSSDVGRPGQQLAQEFPQ